MLSKHAQAILLTSAAVLFALFAVGLGTMLLTSEGLVDPGVIAELGKPMRVALAAFGAVFVAAAFHFVLGGRRQAR